MPPDFFGSSFFSASFLSAAGLSPAAGFFPSPPPPARPRDPAATCGIALAGLASKVMFFA
jgi:hypothetical protein